MKQIICSLILGLMLVIAPSLASSAESASAGTLLAYNKQEVLHGNYSSRIYHNSSCRYYNCKKCTVVFKSRQEAQSKGYRACKKCGG